MSGSTFNISLAAMDMSQTNTFVGPGGMALSVTCGESSVSVWTKSNWTCGSNSLKIDVSSFTLETDEWKFQVHAKPVYGHISGLKRRIDMTVAPVKDLSSSEAPHGLVGQSFDGTGIPRRGRLDQ